MSATHNPTVTTYRGDNPGGERFYADCPCGWEGASLHRDHGAAQDEADAHRAADRPNVATPAPGTVIAPTMTRSDVPPLYLAECAGCGDRVIRSGKGGTWCHVVTDAVACGPTYSDRVRESGEDTVSATFARHRAGF